MSTILQLAIRLIAIVDELEKADELICAAHLQFVVDKLKMQNQNQDR